MMIDDILIDRLVDGELSDAERRALLLQLDAEPDGWRRCALAFLEAQCWREAARDFEALRSSGASFQGGRREDLPHSLGSPGGLPTRAPRRSRAPSHSNRRRWRARLALAAGVLLVFGLGWSLSRFERQASRDPRIEIPLVQGPAGAPAPRPSSPASEETPNAPWPTEPRLVATLQLGGPDMPSYRVPILAGPEIDERWLHSQPAAVPEYVRALWEREGYRVAQRRRVLEMDLSDGHRLEVPLDEIELQYVGLPLP
jgi:hypothetical protein